MSPLVRTHWPSLDEFTLAHSCPHCKAVAGAPCFMRGGRAGQEFHVGRQHRGATHYRQRGWVTHPTTELPKGET